MVNDYGKANGSCAAPIVDIVISAATLVMLIADKITDMHARFL